MFFLLHNKRTSHTPEAFPTSGFTPTPTMPKPRGRFAYDGKTSARLVSGFTLIESLVAIAILLFAVVAPMTVASNGLQAARVARDEVIAFYLAQEAIDYIRSVRDTNILSGEDWFEGLAACTSGGCTVDVFNSATPIQNCSGCDATILFDPAKGYTYSSGDRTPFSRLITVTETIPDREMRIAVWVSWSPGIGAHTVTQETLLLNWQVD